MSTQDFTITIKNVPIDALKNSLKSSSIDASEMFGGSFELASPIEFDIKYLTLDRFCELMATSLAAHVHEIVDQRSSTN